MSTMSQLPRRDALTRADLDAMPDDGRRYELLDGTLLVTPALSLRHQAAVSELIRVLQTACPPNLYVLTAPTDVAYSDDTALQPDVLVIPRSVLTQEAPDLRPLLVIEVLSPSTRRIDETLKKDRYEAAGCPSYWIVDAAEPSVKIWTLTGTSYGPPRRYVDDEQVSVEVPFELVFTPRDLTV